MLRHKYVIAYDVCGRSPYQIAMWQSTSKQARVDARAAKFQRIPRGDPRDKSRGQRGMDLCPAHKIG